MSRRGQEVAWNRNGIDIINQIINLSEQLTEPKTKAARHKGSGTERRAPSTNNKKQSKAVGSALISAKRRRRRRRRLSRRQ